MAKAKLQQIKLTFGDDATQPPFPGGWVLAIFDALSSFAPALAARHRLPISQRTQERIKAAEAVKQCSYDDVEGKLIELVTALFPTVAVINDFAAKYVNEYFRLWKTAAEVAPHWVTYLGFQPEQSGVLSRLLLRDLVLRLCYLESCERTLRGEVFSEDDLGLLRHDAPAQVYAALIREAARRGKFSMEKLAENRGVDDRKLRRLKAGENGPEWEMLRKLLGAGGSQRVLAGVGFIDWLLRRLGLNAGAVRAEVLQVAEVFLPAHHRALVTYGKPRISDSVADGQAAGEVGFAQFAASGGNLLLHPGFDMVWSRMPDALWRTHLYTLQFARVADLAQAYFQFGSLENDRELTRFLGVVERESDGCPNRWMEQLRQASNVLTLFCPAAFLR